MTDVGRVLVTGGASGLGAAVVCAVAAARGCPVVLDRREPPSGVDHEVVDMSDTAATEATVRRVIDRHGGLDAVITCAGTDTPGALDAVGRERWEQIVT